MGDVLGVDPRGPSRDRGHVAETAGRGSDRVTSMVPPGRAPLGRVVGRTPDSAREAAGHAAHGPIGSEARLEFGRRSSQARARSTASSTISLSESSSPRSEEPLGAAGELEDLGGTVGHLVELAECGGEYPCTLQFQ